MPPFFASMLQPADLMLFKHKGLFNTAIWALTRSRFTHIEAVFCVNTFSGSQVVASRNGIGPNIYSLDLTVARVLRPQGKVDVAKAMAWFQVNARGKGYGYGDLVKFLPSFAWMVPKRIQDKGMICSTFVDEWLKAGGFDSFANDSDPGEATPRDFSELPPSVFRVIWDAKG